MSREVEATRGEAAALLTTTTTEVEAGTTAAWEPASAPEATSAEATLVTHHAEEDLRVDAAHASTHAAATEHIVGVNKVLATVIASSLPANLISTDSLSKAEE